MAGKNQASQFMSTLPGTFTGNFTTCIQRLPGSIKNLEFVQEHEKKNRFTSALHYMAGNLPRTYDRYPMTTG